MQIGLLLETDMIPPAVMRRDVQVGGKCFALGTLIHFVPDVRTLTRLGPQVRLSHVNPLICKQISQFALTNGSQVYISPCMESGYLIQITL